MEKKKIFNRVLSGVLIGGLLLSTGGLVVADDQAANKTSNKTAVHGPQFPGQGGGFAQALSQNVLDQLVADAIITQEQADKLLALSNTNAEEQKAQREKIQNMTEEERQALREEQKAKAEELKSLSEEERQAQRDKQKNKKPNDILTQAVSAGIITQDEADAIKDSIQKIAEQQRLTQQQKQMDNLVASGIIDQEQADKIIALAKANAEEQTAKAIEFKNLTEEERQALQEEQKAKQEKIKNMTEEERQALKEERKDKKPNDIFTQAVSAGIMTQDEADAINKSIQDKANQERQQGMQSKIDELVTQGTITAEQAAAIIENMASQEQKTKPDRESIKNMSSEERKADMQEKKNSKPVPFKALVDNGTLTQEQADIVDKSMHAPGNRGGGHAGRF